MTVMDLRRDLRLYRGTARLWNSALRGDPVAQVLCLPRGRDGYARYERIRDRGDLVRGRSGLFMTASYRACSELLRGEDFGAVPTPVSKMKLRPPAGGPVEMVHPLDDSFVSLDPPEHTRLRKMVAPGFTPRALHARRSFVEDVVIKQLDRLDSAEPIELISAYAVQVPSQVICELLGLPRTDHNLFVRWGLEFGAIVDGVRTPRDLRRTRALLAEMAGYFTRLIEHRRERPGDDLLSGLVSATAGGEMTSRGLLATCEALLIGGFVTTANIIGNGVLALLAAPEQRDAFVAEPELAGKVVEEVLRLEAPAQYSVRVARRDVSLAGQDLAEGTPIVALLAAANRDPDVFPDPEQFDINRPNARDHLSFAAGIHYCIGAGLARMEGEIALRALFERFPRLALAGPVRYCPSRVIRGPLRLPVHSREPCAVPELVQAG